MKKSRHVDFLNNGDDFETLILGALGKSTKYIMSRTGYSPGQVLYRLKKQEIRRIDYRDGTSELSERLITVERKVAANFLQKKILT